MLFKNYCYYCCCHCCCYGNDTDNKSNPDFKMLKNGQGSCATCNISSFHLGCLNNNRKPVLKNSINTGQKTILICENCYYVEFCLTFV